MPRFSTEEIEFLADLVGQSTDQTRLASDLYSKLADAYQARTGETHYETPPKHIISTVYPSNDRGYTFATTRK